VTLPLQVPWLARHPGRPAARHGIHCPRAVRCCPRPPARMHVVSAQAVLRAVLPASPQPTCRHPPVRAVLLSKTSSHGRQTLCSVMVRVSLAFCCLLLCLLCHGVFVVSWSVVSWSGTTVHSATIHCTSHHRRMLLVRPTRSLGSGRREQSAATAPVPCSPAGSAAAPGAPSPQTPAASDRRPLAPEAAHHMHGQRWVSVVAHARHSAPDTEAVHAECALRLEPGK